MLLTIDIGNTTILIGVFDRKKLAEHLALSTDREKTSDEYGILLSARINPEKIKGVVISSVVPPLLETFEKMSKQYFHLLPLVVGPGIKTGLTIKYDYPQELGADRIVNAVAVRYLYGGPAIIVDFGTATTFCALSEKGEYLGGAIAPGIGISVEALFEKTALLPRIELIKPRRMIGKNTVESMQSGLIYGFAELVDGIVRRMKKELAKELAKEAKVIATGGWANLVAPESRTIDEVDPLLTLKGLRIISEKNRKR